MRIEWLKYCLQVPMRSDRSYSHRLRIILQRWLDVSPYITSDFGAIGTNVMIDPGVNLTDPRTIYLSDGSAIYRGATVLTGPGIFRMGPRSHLSGGVYINALRAGVHIGTGSAIGPYAVLLSYSNDVIAGQSINESRTEADIVIGDDVFIGAGAIVLPGVTVGDGAVIGAGAVVTRNVKENEIVGGVPARVINIRRR